MMTGGIQKKLGTIVAGAIIGAFALIFAFYGVMPSSGSRSNVIAGSVNGDAISLHDYNRELNRRTEYFKKLSGGKLTDAQLKAFHIRERVFQDLANHKIMAQEARRQGLEASDEQVRDRIREITAFQKNGQFDALTYKEVLAANNQTPGSFELAVREDLSVENLNQYFRNRVQVSDDEVKREFLASHDRRQITYVLLTSDVGRKAVHVAQQDVEKFLKDPSKLNLAKMQYDAKKDSDYKGKTFDQVKESIARDTLAGEKTDEIRKVDDQVADKVVGLLGPGKAAEAKVNAALKEYGIKVQTSPMISRVSGFIPGVGEAKDLIADAFASKSPIDPTQGGKAKKYSTGGWTLVAFVSGRETPDLAKLDADREKLIDQLEFKKQRNLFESYMEKVVQKAKIEKNSPVIDDET